MSLYRLRGLLSLSFHAHVYDRGTRNQGHVLHWARGVYYSKRSQGYRKEGRHHRIYYQGRKERDTKRAKLPEGKVRAPTRSHKGGLGLYRGRVKLKSSILG